MVVVPLMSGFIVKNVLRSLIYTKFTDIHLIVVRGSSFVGLSRSF